MSREEIASVVGIAALCLWVRLATGMWMIEIFNEHLLP